MAHCDNYLFIVIHDTLWYITIISYIDWWKLVLGKSRTGVLSESDVAISIAFLNTQNEVLIFCLVNLRVKFFTNILDFCRQTVFLLAMMSEKFFRFFVLGEKGLFLFYLFIFFIIFFYFFIFCWLLVSKYFGRSLNLEQWKLVCEFENFIRMWWFESSVTDFEKEWFWP